MNDLLLCKPGEIFLKGLNKHYFEERLVANVKRRLKPIGHFRVTYLQSALYIEAADETADLDAAYDAVRKVFGIATITRAAACEKDKDAITALAKTYLHDAMTAARSFKVETKRSDKRFPMTSIELSQYVGGELAEAYARRLQRRRRDDALRRHRQPCVLVHDRQARRAPDSGALFLLPVYLGAGQGKGHLAG